MERMSRTVNPINKVLFEMMERKKTNLCLAVDLTKSSEIIDIVDKMGPHVVIIKIHVDIIEDFDREFIEKMVTLKKKHDFLIFEDRKFADIGATVLKQYVGGIFRIQDWADLVTLHVITGTTTIEALMKGWTSSEPRGVLLIAQMSHKGSLLHEDGVKMAGQIAQQYPTFVSGFISQAKVSNDPGFIQFTPGVNIGSTGDGMGQQYVTPEEAVIKRNADIIIVGRGVLQAEDPVKMLLEFKTRAYSCYAMKNKEN
ncbi:uridine 5'-monophosphate synthase [Tetranychus urticae]|uniref:Orotidine 5'-phosphate decarboxylase n=1 Tax=Tetranychus urticae TaxID=32264 RepID=T1KMZ7_TETUR|nr:uridine 5'-monophosphate synthase [Tetranychus urticae]